MLGAFLAPFPYPLSRVLVPGFPVSLTPGPGFLRVLVKRLLPASRLLGWDNPREHERSTPSPAHQK